MLNPKNVEILIVDDNDISRSMLRHILSSEMFTIAGEAAGGVAAIEWLVKHRAHVVCLDVMMPDISGLDILHHIKQCYPDMLVLMVTGDNKREIVLEAVQAGADGFLIKPFNPAKLIESVYEALRKRRTATARLIRGSRSSDQVETKPTLPVRQHQA